MCYLFIYFYFTNWISNGYLRGTHVPNVLATGFLWGLLLIVFLTKVKSSRALSRSPCCCACVKWLNDHDDGCFWSLIDYILDKVLWVLRKQYHCSKELGVEPHGAFLFQSHKPKWWLFCKITVMLCSVCLLYENILIKYKFSFFSLLCFWLFPYWKYYVLILTCSKQHAKITIYFYLWNLKIFAFEYAEADNAIFQYWVNRNPFKVSSLKKPRNPLSSWSLVGYHLTPIIKSLHEEITVS